MTRIFAASLILAALAAAPVSAGERTVRSGEAPCADTLVGRTVCGADVRTTRSGDPSAEVPADADRPEDVDAVAVVRLEPGFFGGGQAGGVGGEPNAYVSRGRVVVIAGARATASARAGVTVRAGGCGCR
ncbi:hypothetical protein [Caulobacter sp. 17J80-11]|uniref:hypothetical protein n=1 Tax=Caulobacter sp. 17J80-11 TaxID=2763502 RepID=UPI0016539FFF|nr:hypothetical protein [Caulobacter sp. 17J80-11]MBC6982786.1 hypothetical protein [Caulobacter sp. 17J80-11]